jgi:glucuronoarabinoxylan endo-1,4-beta-xylanase
VAAVQGARAATGGRGPLILMSSWSPPPALKSNSMTRNGGTLGPPGGPAFDYAGFGQWWVESLAAFAGAGVVPDYISIQNEPDFSATWESCLFDPSETATRAGYDKALDAVVTAIAGSGIQQPKVVGPESSGIGGARVENYVGALASNQTLGQLDVVAHHLYNGGDGNQPASFVGKMGSLSDLAAGIGKPLWMTEYSPSAGPDMFNTAWLIQTSVAVEGVSAYVYWELVWPPPSMAGQTPGGLVTTTASTWTINDTYYAVRHFAKWIDVGWQRVGAAATAPVIQPSAFASPDGQSLTVVLLNSDTAVHQVTVDPGAFAYGSSGVYRTSGTDERTSSLGPLAGAIMMPSRSIVTVTFGP